MSRDMLMFGMSECENTNNLLNWMNSTDGLHEFMPDPHRLQLEKWIWDKRDALTGRVMDVGVENRRDWIGEGYFTFGFRDCDVVGDLLRIPYEPESLDAILCTEVLEHCVDPFMACREMRRVLKPGGLLMVTSPFVWPWHGNNHYPDYWRFSHQAWQLLLADFSELKIIRCEWSPEGERLYDLLRRFECFGLRKFTYATTGFLVEAVK